ncbi:MAG: 50S ribosomal protein L18 [Endozoicomonadaceae bacterium]|nr:50S ribosomal protein L18 [Endozoicomonadaceae bacterium]
MYDKKMSRMRRALRSRMKIKEMGRPRLTVHRTNRHMYAQIIVSKPGGCDTVVASASTQDKNISNAGKTGNKDAARKVGAEIAKRAKSASIDIVAFDRSGFKFHGRVKDLADAAREGGLQF